MSKSIPANALPTPVPVLAAVVRSPFEGSELGVVAAEVGVGMTVKLLAVVDVGTIVEELKRSRTVLISVPAEAWG